MPANQAHEHSPLFPTHLQIQTTTGCAALCRYCPNRTRGHIKRRLMSHRLFRRIADECGRYHPRHISLYLMADPLTDPRIFEKINYLALQCPTTCIEISTIGELLTPGNVDRLFDSGISELRVSFPSIVTEEYEDIMSGGNIRRAITNIDYLLKRYYGGKDHGFKISAVVLSEAVTDISYEKTIDYWRKKGLDVTSWPVISRAGNLERITAPHHQTLSRCSQGRATHWMHIRYNGELALCCMDYNYRVSIGSVKRRSLKSIWESDDYRRIRAMVAGEITPLPDFPCRMCEWNGKWTANRHIHKHIREDQS